VEDKRVASRGGSNPAHLNPGVYGVWYEYGFVTRNIQARPFMRPAAQSEEMAHRLRLSRALEGVKVAA
jgi:hypothetical protein